jgi:hypothetical protein
MNLSLSVQAFIIISGIFCNLQSLVFAQPAARGANPHSASISGRITIDGQPAAGKKILIADVDTGWGTPGVGTGGGTQGRKYFSAVTDADGRYQLTGLPAGDYEVSVNLLRGYVPVGRQAQRSRSISLAEGKEARDIDFALVRGGVITGRLTDADGNPIIGARVLANTIDAGDGEIRSLEWTILRNGEGTTDDQGVYRIYGLPAGHYRVSADGTRQGPTGGSWTDRGRRYARVYHPNVTEEEKAASVEVREGKEASGININLGKKRPLYEVTGRVVDSVTGEPLSQGQVKCFRIGPNGYHIGGFPTSARIDSQGNFRLAGLPPGRYGLDYSYAKDSDEKKYYREDIIIEVKQGKVSGVEVIARRAATINGTVVFDASSNRALADQLSGATISARVTRKEDDHTVSETLDSSPIGHDDSFSLSGLKPSVINLEISGAPRPHLMRIERDGVEIPNAIAVKSGETIEGIRLVVAYGKGIIRGQINVGGGALPEGMKFRVSVYKESTFEYYGEVKVNRKGRFVIDGLMDGVYYITASGGYATEAIDGQAKKPGPTFDASRRIRITGGRERQVTLTLQKRGVR